MRAFAIVLVCLVIAVCAEAGDNPDVNIFLEFGNGQNYIDPVPWTPFTATVYLENFGPGGGVMMTEFMLVRSFGGMTVSATSLLDGLEIGDPDNGWQITGSCVLPDGVGRVAVAEVTYYYDGITPGTLEVEDHPLAARDVLDCHSGMDSWCVRLSPSGHAGVWVAAPPGDCPSANACIEVTEAVACDISKVGDDVVYQICVTNCSDPADSLYNVTVVDTVLGDLTAFFPSVLAPDEVVCLEFSYQIQPGDDTGANYPNAVLENTVMVTAENGAGSAVEDSAAELVYLLHPGLTVTKTCLTALVPPGDDAEFEIVITNIGDVELDITTDEPEIAPFTLAADTTYTTIVTRTCEESTVYNGINVTGTIPSIYCDLPNEYVVFAEDSCECVVLPCIEVTEAVACDISKVGDDVVYQVCVTNCSDPADSLYNVTVVDTVLGDLTAFFPSVLAPDEVVCLEFSYQIQPGDDTGANYPNAVLENTVMVTAENGAGSAVEDSAAELVYLLHPGLTVTKTCLTALVPPGDDAEFEIVITNIGDVELDITTDEPEIAPFTLAADTTYTTIVTRTCEESTVYNGINVTGTIPSIYCDLPNEYVVFAEDSCECVVLPCIEVTEAVACDISKVGDDVVYQICVTNCSDPADSLYNVTVVDTVLGDLTAFFPSVLAPDEVVCLEFTYQIQPGDDTGVNYPNAVLENTVMVTAENGAGSAVEDSAAELVYLLHPGLTVTKTCLTPLVPPGDDAEFEIVITNTGDVELDITTDEPEIAPFTLAADTTYTTIVTRTCEEDTVYNEIYVTGTIPSIYCDLPNEYVVFAEDSCECTAFVYPLLPTLIDVLDVGNDQGRSVRLRWLRSRYDAPGELFSISSYEVYRRQDAQLAKKQAQPGSESAADGVRGGSRIDGWDYVETIPAHGDSVYQYVAPTLCDSTADGGICWSVFLIRGTTSDPYVYFDSPPDSGYSVDNLAPAPPAGLLADGDELLVTLTWDISEEDDFDYYAVYRDVVEGFEPGEPIGLTSDPTYEDTDPPAASEWWYKVTAFDFSGNESDPSLPAGTISTGVTDLVPTVFWLGPAVPNPFNPATDVHYWVPSGQQPCHLTLIIHDSAGRVIRHLVDSVTPPGVHSATWDGTDDGGSPIASGVYFCRMSAAGFEKVRKITLLK